MANIDDRLHDLVSRRRQLPGSIGVMETGAEAERLNMNICALEGYTMRLAACWDGEMDPIGAYSQLAYLHEKADEPKRQPPRSARRSNDLPAGTPSSTSRNGS